MFLSDGKPQHAKAYQYKSQALSDSKLQGIKILEGSIPAPARAILVPKLGAAPLAHKAQSKDSSWLPYMENRCHCWQTSRSRYTCAPSIDLPGKHTSCAVSTAKQYVL
eukprot:6487339-Amphidinium_carterae.2